ncbi:MAG: glycosyltransferase family 4 protein [Chloroflexi bacterium]|nr:glycosyltransferase family 4 protein [Chloroflexota bacterium]
MLKQPTTYILDTRTVTDHFPGIGRYVSQLATHLVPLLAEDERLLLLRYLQTGSRWQLPPAGENVVYLQTAVSPFSLQQQWHIPRLLRQNEATIYHSAYYLMPYRPGVPTLLTLYDLIPEQFPQLVSPQARLLFRLATRLALRAGDHFLAISEATRDAFLARYTIPTTKITAVPLAADARFTPQAQTAVASLRQKQSLPNKYILYLGINKPHKNLLRLIMAWKVVIEQLPDAPPLIIAGAWDTRYEEVKTAVSQHNLNKKVRFLGPIPNEDLPTLYSGATLFVFPSLVEGFGLPVLEAMACGTAVACANNSSLPEVGGNAAAYFDPTDSQQMAKVLQNLLQDEHKRQGMSKRGLVQARKFSWQETAVATLSHYRNLAAASAVGKPPSPSPLDSSLR